MSVVNHSGQQNVFLSRQGPDSCQMLLRVREGLPSKTFLVHVKVDGITSKYKLGRHCSVGKGQWCSVIADSELEVTDISGAWLGCEAGWPLLTESMKTLIQGRMREERRCQMFKANTEEGASFCMKRLPGGASRHLFREAHEKWIILIGGKNSSWVCRSGLF